MALRNLLRLAALRRARILNHSELGRNARLPVATVTRYLGRAFAAKTPGVRAGVLANGTEAVSLGSSLYAIRLELHLS